ncbi:MAG: hypothetical protein ACREBR_03790, partial [bacterium]
SVYNGKSSMGSVTSWESSFSSSALAHQEESGVMDLQVDCKHSAVSFLMLLNESEAAAPNKAVPATSRADFQAAFA